MKNHRALKGQAFVEFALAATLIFLLLVAAVDLGLIFFTLQGLNNAAQEGATYGSRWLLTTPTGGRVLDYAGIRDRVRHESGNRGGIGFVNLLDLNNNGIPDVNPDTPGGSQEVGSNGPIIDDYIQIYALQDTNGDGNPLNDGAAPNYTPCPDIARAPISRPCYIRVLVSSEYKLVFPLAPAFDDQVRIYSSYVMRMRDSSAQGS